MLTTDINIRPSKIFSTLVVAVILSTLVIILTLPLHILWKLALIVVICSYGLMILKNECLLMGKHSIHSIFLNNEGWWITMADVKTPAIVWGDSTLSAFASVVRFKIPASKRKYSCVIFRDAVPLDDYRRLMVLLRTNPAITL
jgi:hypothetical protein